MMKKLLALMLTLIMSLSVFTGCASKGESSDKKDVKKRVAIILEGAISDMSWNATAYAGLKKIEAMGAEVAYVENVPAASVTDSIRTYADEKYDVIFLSTNSYADAGAAAAKDYPNTQFFMINSGVIAKNVASFAIQDAEQGFLMGALAALLTKSGTVGFVGGLEINPIINGGKGFQQGAKYVNPNVKVISTNTGSFDNVSAAKETAKAMIGQGVDVLAPMANQSSLGVMEAAEEAGIKGIGSGLNQEKVAPKAAVVAIVKDTSIAYEAAYKAYLDGTISDKVLKMGEPLHDGRLAHAGVAHEQRVVLAAPRQHLDGAVHLGASARSAGRSGPWTRARSSPRSTPRADRGRAPARLLPLRGSSWMTRRPRSWIRRARCS